MNKMALGVLDALDKHLDGKAVAYVGFSQITWYNIYDNDTATTSRTEITVCWCSADYTLQPTTDKIEIAGGINNLSACRALWEWAEGHKVRHGITREVLWPLLEADPFALMVEETS